MTGEFHHKGLGQGYYREVLSNEHGAFYLAPPKGFWINGKSNSGFGVGGIYLSNEHPDEVFLWDYLLKNNKRDFSNPNTSRTLSQEQDQPERLLFLDPTWYASERRWFLGRPLIDKDFKLDRSLFKDTPTLPSD